MSVSSLISFCTKKLNAKKQLILDLIKQEEERKK